MKATLTIVAVVVGLSFAATATLAVVWYVHRDDPCPTYSGPVVSTKLPRGLDDLPKGD